MSDKPIPAFKNATKVADKAPAETVDPNGEAAAPVDPTPMQTASQADPKPAKEAGPAPDALSPLDQLSAAVANAKEAEPAPEVEAARVVDTRGNMQSDALDKVTFMSKYPALNIYVQHRGMNLRLEFRHGILQVDKSVAKAVRAHKRFNRLFREANNRDESALRAELERQRERLQGGAISGLDTSTAGSDFQINQGRGKIDAAAQNLIDL